MISYWQACSCPKLVPQIYLFTVHLRSWLEYPPLVKIDCIRRLMVLLFGCLVGIWLASGWHLVGIWLAIHIAIRVGLCMDPQIDTACSFRTLEMIFTSKCRSFPTCSIPTCIACRAYIPWLLQCFSPKFPWLLYPLVNHWWLRYLSGADEKHAKFRGDWAQPADLRRDEGFGHR